MIKRYLLLATFILASLAVSAPVAWAQDGGGTEWEEEATLDTAPVDERLDLYWAKEREISVVQKRLFMKEARHEFTLFFGTIPNDEFYSYFPIGLRWDYFFIEDLGLEVWGAYDISMKSDLKEFLESNTLDQLLVEIPQTLVWMAGVSGIWSPIHGKVKLFETKLAHFDIFVAFGAGVIGTEVVNAQTKVASSKFDVSGSLGLGMRFYINDWISIRSDYRQYFYPAETGGVAHPAEFTLGVGFFTPAPR